ncbi:calcium/sodium antiporter [Pseudobutyrivibrio xylanivorans]|uniref:Calcium/sodium antiporter n=1 Tax=Pseudobutyrivibrio xylanivorans TaxID=185007 RepID=A0A5P6VTJ3_PSEXY|nr:calcium/sodium antiporter [Pseudobutyrivibrio xylanivorans]QFJ54201.1 calcium/sodium antiporter [Pseudobutyrivibrio xylanivorans]
MATFLQTIPGALILLVLGFVFLIKGADFFVEGASAVANKLHVPPLVIGMTIVAMGTSLPELSVSVTASMAGSNQLAIGNVVGSNIFNLMVVLGSCALFSVLEVAEDTIKKDFPFSVCCAVVLAVMGWIGMEVGHIDGVILLVGFIIFLLSMLHAAKKSRKEAAIEAELDVENEIEDIPVWKCILYIVGGAIAIKFGGDWVVNSCTTLALRFGMSETLVGLTIVALGTSLPELVTSVVAAKKNALDMAIGNVVGSNIFNILLILGAAAAISPITFMTVNAIDIIILVCFSIIVWMMCYLKKNLGRFQGIIMLVLYVGYLAYIIIRDGGIA